MKFKQITDELRYCEEYDMYIILAGWEWCYVEMFEQGKGYTYTVAEH